MCGGNRKAAHGKAEIGHTKSQPEVDRTWQTSKASKIKVSLADEHKVSDRDNRNSAGNSQWQLVERDLDICWSVG